MKRMSAAAPESCKLRVPTNRIELFPNHDILGNNIQRAHVQVPVGSGMISSVERDTAFFASPACSNLDMTSYDEPGTMNDETDEYAPSYVLNETLVLGDPYSYEPQSDADTDDAHGGDL